MEPAITGLFNLIVGPWGATFLLLVIVVYQQRKLEESQARERRGQELFDKALDIIKNDLVPIAKELAERRRR